MARAGTLVTKFAPSFFGGEIANNAFRGGAAGHDESRGAYAERRAAAIQAYYEWQPVREPAHGDRTRIYRSFSVGNLLAVHMLDTRHAGRDAPLDYAQYVSANGALDTARLFGDLRASERTMLGAEQRAWLDEELALTSARYHVLAQQVLMGPMWLPAPIVTERISPTDYFALYLKARIDPQSLTPAERALLAEPNVPFNLDAWDGYLGEREALLRRAAELGLDLIVLSGDSHNAWASDLQDERGAPVGVEFATPSVSSRGIEERVSDSPDLVAFAALSVIPTLRYAQTSLRGYLVVRFRESDVEASYHFVDSVFGDVYTVPPQHVTTLRVAAGARRITT